MDTSMNTLLNKYSSDVHNAKTNTLESTLKPAQNSEQTDEEMMEVAKQFESYLVEQVMSKVKENMLGTTEEEDNKYVDYFGDVAMQEFAPILSEKANLGIAQQLYEAMKVNSQNVIPTSVAEKQGEAAAEKLSVDTETAKQETAETQEENTDISKISAISMS